MVNTILVLNLLVFLLWMVPVVPVELMADHFLISWAHLAEGRVWTLVTAVFSHTLLFHLLINMVVLMSFGPPLERLMGSGRFLLFYLMAGVTGSLAHAAVSHLLMGQPELAALGASSAIAGILVLFSFVFPRARVLLFFFIPVPAIVGVLIFVGIDIWGLLMQLEGVGLPIGHGAHLGGAAAGGVFYLVRASRLRELTARRRPHGR